MIPLDIAQLTAIAARRSARPWPTVRRLSIGMSVKANAQSVVIIAFQAFMSR
jgi:hypothetical protein